MKVVIILAIGAAIGAFRLWLRSRRRRSASPRQDAAVEAARATPTEHAVASPAAATEREATTVGAPRESSPRPLEDVRLVAGREIRERVKGRIFRVGTIVILGVVAAAIIVPTIHKNSGPTVQTVGVVGALPPEVRPLVLAAGVRNQDHVHFVTGLSLDAAKTRLRSGNLDLAIVHGDQVLLNEPATDSSSPADPGFVDDVAAYLGVLKAYRDAGLTPGQAATVDRSKPVPVHTLEGSAKTPTRATSIIGLVLLFFMLTQYCTWILIGVMQEKSSRVVEVLLATLRPLQLLGGKVLGIGLVAFGQAALIVGFALLVGRAVGSDLLHGSAPLVLATELLWLILGYAFYCWVYAAAGSTAERQDQVQTLALPLSIPILIAYIYSITVASAGNPPSLLFKALAYFPPTAPFCMPVLVGLHQVTWWEFVLSVLITIAGTVAVAVFAARVYRRAVLQTGARVHLRDLVLHSTR